MTRWFSRKISRIMRGDAKGDVGGEEEEKDVVGGGGVLDKYHATAHARAMVQTIIPTRTHVDPDGIDSIQNIFKIQTAPFLSLLFLSLFF